MTPVEPLDPVTLAFWQRRVDGLPEFYMGNVAVDHEVLAALLAVARVHARLTAENERYRLAGEEAVERLSEVSSIFTEAAVGDLTQAEAWNGIERALRGPPPEGEAVVPRLAAALAASVEAPTDEG